MPTGLCLVLRTSLFGGRIGVSFLNSLPVSFFGRMGEIEFGTLTRDFGGLMGLGVSSRGTSSVASSLEYSSSIEGVFLTSPEVESSFEILEVQPLRTVLKSAPFALAAELAE